MIFEVTSTKIHQPTAKCNFKEEDDAVAYQLDASNELPLHKIESKSGLSMLTRATSFSTWDSTDTLSRKTKKSYYEDEEAQIYPSLTKNSYSSYSGITILPTIYGAINELEDDSISDCSYVTGIQEDYDNDSQIGSCAINDGSDQPDIDNDSRLSFASVRSENEASTYTIEEIISGCIENKDLESILENVPEDPKSKTYFTLLLDSIAASSVMVQTKSKGVKSRQSAPKLSLSECIWCFTGSFTIISVLCLLSSSITLWNEHGYAFPLGPFGALTTLQYSLVDVAPAQPRNTILGSTISGCIAMGTTYIPETIIPSPIRIAFATSLSIALMAALGIIHPPGGAIALVFSLGQHHWGHLLLTLGGCWIAVLFATVINNLNPQRQYPQYWNFSAPFVKS